MYNDSKSTHAVFVGLANTIRQVCSLAETINAVLGQVADDGPHGRIYAELAVNLDNFAPMLVLAAQLDVVAEAMAVRDPVLRKMRRQQRLLESASTASRQSAGSVNPQQEGAEEDTQPGMPVPGY